jgi:hypothetical protein
MSTNRRSLTTSVTLLMTALASAMASLGGQRRHVVQGRARARVPEPTNRPRKMRYVRTDLIHPPARHRVQPAPYIAAPGSLMTMDSRNMLYGRGGFGTPRVPNLKKKAK